MEFWLWYDNTIGDSMSMSKKVRDIIHDIDKPLFFVTTALFIFGLLNIVTASSQASVLKYNASLYGFFYKQLIFLLVGFCLFIYLLLRPTNQYLKYGFLSFVGVTGLMVYLTMYGNYNKGSLNWIRIGPFSIQPSELAKPVMIMCLSVLFELFYIKLRFRNHNHYDLIGIILVAGCLFPIFVFFQKDLGTMIILFLLFISMFLSSPILRIDKIKTIALGVILVLCASSILIAKTGHLLTKTQLSRFDFFNPCADYESGGYQICNGFIAINEGGLFGVGIGNSKQVSYIPESHTDSVFAIIAEEYGFLKASVIFISYIIVLYRILKLSMRANTIRGRYICFGVAVYIFLHIVVNLGGLFGVMPLTGVPLPFLSYGGSFTLSLIISLGMVQRVHIETQNQKIDV